MVVKTESSSEDLKLSKSRESDWPSVLFFIHIHLLSIYGIWLLFFEVKLMTLIFLIILTSLGVLGVTAGSHRLWAHHSYSASTGLRIFLMLIQTLAGQGSIFDWVKLHRLHHAQFGTDGDPFDYTKGFMYAHVFTRLRKLSPYQEKLNEEIDMSDLEKDSVVMFQKKIYWLLYGVVFLLLPLNAPLEYWGESITNTVFVIGFLRYLLVLRLSFLVDSGVSLWGLKPGEKYPPDSNSVFLLNRTFWPHYHYLMPYDYKSGEFGTYDSGCTSAFIRVCAALGLASHLQTVEAHTLQRALAEVAKTKKPLKLCLQEALKNQSIPEDHYLRRG